MTNVDVEEDCAIVLEEVGATEDEDGGTEDEVGGVVAAAELVAVEEATTGGPVELEDRTGGVVVADDTGSSAGGIVAAAAVNQLRVIRGRKRETYR
jgi:hypothetical protein